MAAKKQPEEHITQKPFGELLAQFVGTGDGAISPYSDGRMSISPATLSTVKKERKKKDDRPVPGDTITSMLDELDDDDLGIDSLTSMVDVDEYNSDFDDFIEEAFEHDENVTMRNNLIAMGRKYAIKAMDEAGESSEVERSFARQEQALIQITEEIAEDEQLLGRDLELLRGVRGRNYKALADLASAKGSLHTAKLSAVSKMIDLQKTKWDISIKLKKERNEDATDSGMAATQAVQRLLSVGRQNLMPDDEDDSDYAPTTSYDDGRPETAIHMASDLPPISSDGDKFIAHEDDGVEYVLDISSDDDHKQIYAVNRNGEIVPNYPMPSNVDELHFTMNELAGEAIDQLQRRYRIRRDGRDVTDPTPTFTEEEE